MFAAIYVVRSKTRRECGEDEVTDDIIGIRLVTKAIEAMLWTFTDRTFRAQQAMTSSHFSAKTVDCDALFIHIKPLTTTLQKQIPSPGSTSNDFIMAGLYGRNFTV